MSRKPIKIGEAAELLGVSIDTLRRWDASGKLISRKTPAGTRFYALSDLKRINPDLGTESVPTMSELLSKPEPVITPQIIKPVPVAPITSTESVQLKNSQRPLRSPLYAHRYLFAILPAILILFFSASALAFNFFNIRSDSSKISVNSLANDQVLGSQTIKGFLEINADLAINGNASISGSINNLKLLSTPNSQLNISGNVSLDQNLRKTDSPTFASITTNTNKKISFPDATGTVLLDSTLSLKNIPNSSLANSKITITAGSNLTGGGDVELGGSVSIAVNSDPSFNSLTVTGGTPGLGKVLTSDENGLATWQVSSSGAWTVDGSNIFYTAGNVGIGTTNPQGLLHVAGDIVTTGLKSSGNIVIAPGNTTAATFSSANLSMNNLPIVNIGNSGTDFGTNGSLTLANSLTVTSGGISITSGGLEVQAGGISLSTGQSISSVGTLAVSTSDWGISQTGSMTGITGISNDGGYTQTGSNSNTFTGFVTMSDSATVSGTLGVGSNLTVRGNILPQYDSTYDLGSPSSQWNNIYARNLVVGTPGIAGYWQRDLGVVAPANITDDLIIGGTATASAKFQVSGETGTVRAGTWNGTVIGTQYGGTGQNWSAVTTGSLPYFSNTGTLSTLAADTANKILVTGTTPSWVNISSLLSAGTDIQIVGTNIVTLNDTSTLSSVTGRGATTATALEITNAGTSLDLYGQVKIRGGSPGVGKVLTSDANGLATWETATGGISGSGTTNYVTKYTASNTLGISSIFDNGNVGIGTTSPSALLDVSGTAWLRGTGTSGLFVTSSGNVGIGTTAPSGKFQIVSPVSTANAIPNMSSYTIPSGVASASNTFNNYYAWKAFDGTNTDQSDSWVVQHSVYALPQWIQYQFPTAQIITSYAITERMEGSSSRSPKSWEFQGSNNGTDFTTLDTQTNITDWAGSQGIRKSFTISNTTAYLYYRINITAANDPSWVGMGIIQMYTEGTSLFASASSGYVGIGEINPASSLSVFGNFSVGDTTYTQVIAPTNGAIIQGNVGIGTTNPGQLFDVANKFQVDSNGNIVKINNVTTSFPSSQGGANTVLVNNGSGTLTWGTVSSSNWQRTSGSIAPLNITDSLNLGATATTSALVHLAGTSGENSWINTGNVGIGTTNPGAHLQISSALAGTSSTDVFRLYDAGGVLRTNINARGLQTWKLNSGTADVGSIVYTTPSGSPGIVIFTGSTFDQNRFNIANFGTYFGLGFDADNSGNGVLNIKAGGNVGIGTTSPAARIHAYAASGPVNQLVQSGANTWAFLTVNDAGSPGFIWDSSHTFTLATSTDNLGNGYSPKFAIKNNGNVGIGTTNPGALFDVANKFTVDSNGNLTKINNVAYSFPASQAGGSGYALTNNGSGTLSWSDLTSSGNVGVWTLNGSTIYPDQATYNVAIGGTSALATLDVKSISGIQPIASFSGRTSFAGLVVDNSLGDLFTASSSGLSRFVITQNGNVGIGTTNPGANFEVVGGTAPIIVRNTNPISYEFLDVRNDQNSNLRSLSFGYTGSSYVGPANTNGITGEVGVIRTTGNYPLDFGTNLTSRMVILGNGNVGIGTTAPGTMFDVANKFQVDSNGNIVKLNNITTSFPGSQGVAGSVLTNDGSGTLTWSGGTGGSGVSGFWQRTSGSLAPANITDSLNLGATATTSALVHLAGTSGENSWINTGNVGIGTTSPGSILETRGSSPILTLSDTGNNYNQNSIQSTLYFNGRWNSGTANPSDDAYSDAAIKLFKDNTDGNGGSGLSFWTSGAGSAGLGERLRIDKAGNVGIGTTTPGGPLEVSHIGTTDSEFTMFTVGQSGGSYGTYNFRQFTSSGYANQYLALQTIGNAGTFNDVMVWSAKSGNVGIGTTNPGQLFDVANKFQVNSSGNIVKLNNITTSFPGSQGVAGSVLTNNGSGTLTWSGGTGGSGVSGFWQRTSGSLAPANITDSLNLGATATTSALVHLAGTSGENSWINTGNVGIGTTSPAALLDIASLFTVDTAQINANVPVSFNAPGDVGIASDLQFTNLTSSFIKSFAPLYLESGDYNNSSDLTLRTFNSGNLVVDSQALNILYSATVSGQLLVGTSSATPNIGNFYLTNSQTFGKALAILNQNEGADIFTASASGATRFTITSSGNINIPGLTASSAVYTDASKNLTSTAPTTGVLGFWQRTSGSLAPLNITDSLNLGATATTSALVHLAGTSGENSWINTGNVGIGTTSPDYPLTIAANSGSNAWDGSMVVYDTKAQAQGTGGGITFGGKYNSAGSLNQFGYIRSVKQNSTDGNFSFDLALGSRLNGTGSLQENMRLQAGGNVGIGTTNPGAMLDVNRGTDVPLGRFYNTKNNGGTSNLVQIYDDRTYSGATTGSMLDIYSRNDTTANMGAGYYYMKVYHGSPEVGVFAITGAGNVGIGTTSPTAVLQVFGNSTTQVASISAQTGKAALLVDNTIGDLFTASSSGLSRFVITQNGNVGIGTTSPSQLFSVGSSNNFTVDSTGGVTIASPANLQINKSNNTAGNTSINLNNVAGIRLTSVGDIAFDYKTGGNWYNGVTMLNANGNVGIGTTAPAQKLEVAGTAQMTGFKLTTSPASGYALVSDAAGVGTWTDLTGVGGGSIGPWTLSSTNLYPDQTTYKVVIGGTSALATLDVRGNSGITPVASISGQTAFAGMVVDNTIGDLFTASSSGLTRFVITQNGNVGIGIAQPSALLDVNSLFTVDTAQANFAVPVSFNAPGDVSMAYDLVFNNLISSNIKSSAPLAIESGEVVNSSDLTLRTFNAGNVVIDSQALNILYSATVSGQLAVGTGVIQGRALVALNQTEAQDIFTASASGVTKFTINNSGAVTTGIWNGTAIGTSYIANAGTQNQILIAGASVPAWGNIASLVSGTGNISITGTQTLSVNTIMNPNFTTSVQTPTIGIGTGTFLATLDVRGNSGITPIASFSGQTAFAGMVVDNSGVGDIFTASSSGLNRFVIKQNGNVGIGTTSPGAKLEVAGNILMPAESWIGPSSTAGIYYKAGNVGIGTTNPIAKLDVNGTASISGSLTATSIVGTAMQTLTLGDASTGKILVNSANGLDMNNKIITNIGNAGTDFDTNGGLTLANSLTVTTGGITVTAGGETITAGGLTVTAGNISLTGTQSVSATGDLTVASGVSNVLKLNPDGGNIQMGTLSYAWPSSQSNGAVLTTNGSGTLTWTGGSGSGISGFWQRTSGSLAPTNITDSLNLGATATTSALVHLAGTSGENSWINTGNVGIGTTGPSAKLNVVAGALSAGTSGSIFAADATASMWTSQLLISNTGTINSQSRLLFSDATAGEHIAGIVAARTGTTQGYIALQYRSATSANLTDGIKVDQNGNITSVNADNATVGMTIQNTASGGNPYLRVQSAANRGANIYLNSNSTDILNLAVASNATYASMIANTGYGLQFYTNNAIVQTINTSGNVGIGTTSPTSTLHILPSGTVTGAILTARGTTSSTAGGIDLSPTIATNATAYGIYSEPIFSPTGNITSANGYLALVRAQNSSSNITTMRGFYVSNRTSANYSGTLTNAQGLYIETPSYSGSAPANQYGLYIDNQTGGTSTNYSIYSAGGSMYHAGNVGIGTTNPIAKLDLVSTLGTAPAASISAQSAFAAMVVDNKGVGDIFTASSSGLNRFVINQNGNIGVGVTTATAAMDVNGRIYSRTGGVFADLFQAYTGGSTLMRIAGGSSGDVALEAGGSEVMRLKSGGNVGIGTTSPIAKLDVRLNGTTSVASISGTTSFASLIVDNTLGDLFTASSSGLNRFVIKQNGNVGIGIAQPSALLDVNSLFTVDTAQINANVPVSFNAPGDVAIAYDLVFTNPTASYIKSQAPLYFEAGENFNSSDLTLRTFNSGNVIVDSQAFVANYAATVSGQLLVGTSSATPNIGNFYLTNNATYGKALAILNQNESQDIFTASASGATKFTITSGGNINIPGLTASSAVYTDASKNLTSTIPTSGALGFWQRTSGSLAPTNITDSLNLGATATTSALVHLAGTAAENSFINTGNVGIGTTSPFSKLDIIGAASIHISSSAVDSGGYFDTAGVNAFYLSGGAKYNSYTSDYVFMAKTTAASGQIMENGNSYFYGNSSLTGGNTFTPTKIMTIIGANSVANTLYLTAGKVAVGTNSPLSTFDVRGSSGITPIASFSGQTAFAGMVVDNSGVGDLFTASSSGLNRFVIKQNGNVGIGFATPLNKLYVYDSAKTSTTPGDNVIASFMSNANGADAAIHFGDSNGNYARFGSINNSLYFAPAGTEKMRINDVGSLGIGTTLPLATLDVRYNSGTTPVASISGETAMAALIVDNKGSGDLFTASISGATKFTIAHSGDVTIYGSATTCVIGNGTSGTSCSSDERLKTNITDLGSTLNKVLELRPVNFEWNNDGSHTVNTGLIAQDVQKIFPELVHQVGNTGYLGIDYAGLTVPLIQATKDISEQLKDIPQIKSDIALLKEEMASASARLTKVEESPFVASASANLRTLSDLSNLSYLNIDNLATISGQLTVLGKTQLSETSIGGNLNVGFLHFDDIKAEISSLTGLVTVKGDLKVEGQIMGESVETKGLNMKDKTTGEMYCIQVDNGEMVKTKGKCE